MCPLLFKEQGGCTRHGHMQDFDKEFRCIDHGTSSMNSNNYEDKTNELRGGNMSAMLHEASRIYVDDENMGIDGDSFIESNLEGPTSEPSNDVNVEIFLMFIKYVEDELHPG